MKLKKIFALGSLMVSLLGSAQGHRAQYEMTSISDSTNRAQVQVDLMNLDIVGQKSRFYNPEMAKRDSAMMAAMTKAIETGGAADFRSMRQNNPGADNARRNENSRLNVEKDLTVPLSALTGRIMADAFKVVDKTPLQWKIEPETQVIAGYPAQKATTRYAGRDWIAWFTTEIPMQDGPYRFYGLPGLILQMEDKTGSYKFSLKSFKKMDTLSLDYQDPIANNRFARMVATPTLEVSREQYGTKLREFRADPAAAMSAMMNRISSMGGNVSISFNGRSTDVQALARRNQAMKERFAKDNNPIELDLLKK